MKWWLSFSLILSIAWQSLIVVSCMASPPEKLPGNNIPEVSGWRSVRPTNLHHRPARRPNGDLQQIAVLSRAGQDLGSIRSSCFPAPTSEDREASGTTVLTLPTPGKGRPETIALANPNRLIISLPDPLPEGSLETHSPTRDSPAPNLPFSVEASTRNNRGRYTLTFGDNPIPSYELHLSANTIELHMSGCLVSSATADRTPLAAPDIITARTISIPAPQKPTLEGVSFRTSSEPHTLRLQFSRLPSYTVHYQVDGTATIALRNTIASRSSLLLPRFPPRSFSGIQGVQAAQQGDELRFTIIADPSQQLKVTVEGTSSLVVHTREVK